MNDRDRQGGIDQAATGCACLFIPLAVLLLGVAGAAVWFGHSTIAPIAGIALILLGIVALLVHWAARPFDA